MVQMNLIRRVKNLWRLSEYRTNDTDSTLKKDFPTIQKKLATIVKDDKEDLFPPEENEPSNN
jgi:hypothetical protein